MTSELPPLVNQPSINPTRKWTAARIAEVVAALLAFVVLAFDVVELSEDDIEKIAGGVGLLVTVAGAVAGWVTRNRATHTTVVMIEPEEPPSLT